MHIRRKEVDQFIVKSTEIALSVPDAMFVSTFLPQLFAVLGYEQCLQSLSNKYGNTWLLEWLVSESRYLRIPSNALRPYLF